jgi:hypothetical protein
VNPRENVDKRLIAAVAITATLVFVVPVSGAASVKTIAATPQGHFRMAATETSSQATSGWKIGPSPNVTGAGQSRLNGISCVSSSRCEAVGAERSLIEELRHGTWKVTGNREPTS